MNIAQRFGRYEIQSEIGRGSMATVYHARDPKFEREVALKVLPREMLHDPQFRARFENEVKIIAGLEHAAIVPVYDGGEENGQPYFVMRYMPGASLATRIKKEKLSLQEAARIIEKIAPALAYAHQKGIIHRDLKPDNILFDNNHEPFISDFGIAKLFSGGTGSLTGKEYVGTPAYMSPEQAQGEKMDGRSDVYSLGAVIYEMLTGEPPYSAENPIGIAIQHIMQPIPEVSKMLPGLPKEVDIVIQTAMAKNKDQRYETPIELANALKIAASKESSSGWMSRVKTGLIFTAITMAVAVMGFFLLRDQLFASAPVTLPPAATVIPPTFTAHPSNTPTAALTSTPASTATETLLPTSTTLPFAPACASTTAVPTPVVNWLNNLCYERTPYTMVSIPEGAAFQSLDPRFKCKAETTKNGKTTISCTGLSSYTFNLKVCKTLPIVNSAQCPPDSIFDETNQCCAAAPSPDAGCTIYKVDIRSCP